MPVAGVLRSMEIMNGQPGKRLGPVMLLVLGLSSLLAASPTRDPATPLRWRRILEGEQEALAAGKPVLYFFTADWCAPCEVLKRTLFQDEDVIELVERQFVPIAVVDREQEDGVNPPEVEALGFRFLVTGLPTLVVARARGGPAVSQEGASGTERTMAFLRGASKGLRDLEAAAERGRRVRLQNR
jgi:thiol:disulfide interchange protein